MSPGDHDRLLILAIAGAALVTYALRFGGLLLSEKLPRTGAFKIFLEALPGTILISIVMPGIMAAGIWGWIAAGLTALLARKTGNTFVAMLAGVAVVALSRFLHLYLPTHLPGLALSTPDIILPA